MVFGVVFRVLLVLWCVRGVLHGMLRVGGGVGRVLGRVVIGMIVHVGTVGLVQAPEQNEISHSEWKGPFDVLEQHDSSLPQNCLFRANLMGKHTQKTLNNI